MGELVSIGSLHMNDSFMKRLWLMHTPKLLVTYWLGVAIYTVIMRPDAFFIIVQLVATMTMIFGMMAGYHEGIKDASKNALHHIKEMERNYIITFVRRDKDE